MTQSFLVQVVAVLVLILSYHIDSFIHVRQHHHHLQHHHQQKQPPGVAIISTSIDTYDDCCSHTGSARSHAASSVTITWSTTKSVSSSSSSELLNTLHQDLDPSQILDFMQQGHTCIRQLLTGEEVVLQKPIIMKGIRSSIAASKQRARTDLFSLLSLSLYPAFEDEELEALRHEVRVFFGDKAYKKCCTIEQCQAKLKQKGDDDITPFLQVFNLWRKHESIRTIALSKRLDYIHLVCVVLRPASFLLITWPDQRSFCLCLLSPTNRIAHVAAQLLGVERARLYQDR